MSLAEELRLPASLGRVPMPGQRRAPGGDPWGEGVAAEPSRRGSGSVSAGREPSCCSELRRFGLAAELGTSHPQAPVTDVPGPSCSCHVEGVSSWDQFSPFGLPRLGTARLAAPGARACPGAVGAPAPHSARSLPGQICCPI